VNKGFRFAVVLVLFIVPLLLQGCLLDLLFGPDPTPIPTAKPFVPPPPPPPTPTATTSGLGITDPVPPPAPPPPPMPPDSVRTFPTGRLTLGTTTPLASVNIPANGGTVTVDTGPIAGLTINVPTGAHNATRSYRVSSAPINGNTFKNITPVTPLITVDNGGGYAEEVITVKVPFKTPAGKFAMGFFYDTSTGRLEGIPSLSGPDMVTLATRHFSSFFLSMVDLALLETDIDSGFRPGIDDWQFTNYGSYIASDGHCAGQALSAMWYYVTRPDGANATLNKRYDNNGKQPAPPNLWQDDSWGYRLASTVQLDAKASIFTKFWNFLRGYDDIINWRNFAYSMLATGEPQMVSIESSLGGAHVMVIYQVNKSNLYVADPNYPGRNDRRIEFVNGQFKPYNSGDNAAAIAAGKGKPYEKIGYWGKSTLAPWDVLPQRWQEFKAGTIGNDRFPSYKIGYLDAKGQMKPLTDGMTFNNPKLSADLYEANFYYGLQVYRDGAWLGWDAQGNLDLKKGENLLGFRVNGALSGSSNTDKYVDFRWVKVNYVPLEPGLSLSPGSWSGNTEQTVTFIASSKAPPARASYEWLVDGVSLIHLPDSFFIFVPPAAGTFTITCQEWDESTGKITVTARATAIVKQAATPTPTTDLLSRLQKFNRFSAAFGQGKSTYNYWNVKEGSSSGVSNIQGFNWRIPEQHSYPLAITWSGTTFTGSYTINQPTYKYFADVKGTVSADGKTLLTVTHNCRITSTGTNFRNEPTESVRVVLIALQNLPIWDAAYQKAFAPVTGSDIGKHIARLQDETNYSVSGKLTSRETYVSTVWNSSAGIGGNFTYSSGN